MIELGNGDTSIDVEVGILELARGTALGKPASAECFDLSLSLFTLEAPGSPDDIGGGKPPLPIGGAVDVFDIEF